MSVARLFAAGVLPGLLIAGLYSAYIMARCAVRPELSPTGAERYTLGERLAGTVNLIPIFVLMVLVLGSIYTGLATPSEAAAVGVASALALTLLMRQMTWRVFQESLMGAVKTSPALRFIIRDWQRLKQAQQNQPESSGPLPPQQKAPSTVN